MPSTEIYTLSLHDALPIFLPVRGPAPSSTPRRAGVSCSPGYTPQSLQAREAAVEYVAIALADPIHRVRRVAVNAVGVLPQGPGDRKSTRLNSSHMSISYAVHRDLHSFPTRRSSDLPPGSGACALLYPEARRGFVLTRLHPTVASGSRGCR